MQKKTGYLHRLVATLAFSLILFISLSMVQSEAASTDGVAIDETNFPGIAFRAMVEHIDPNSDGYLDRAELDSITAIDVNNRFIIDMTGIQYFTNLTSLNCSNNLIRELDLSQNTKLTVLQCYNNEILHLDLSSCPDLGYLNCDNNQLGALNVLSNPKLSPGNMLCGKHKVQKIRLPQFIDGRFAYDLSTLPDFLPEQVSGFTDFNFNALPEGSYEYDPQTGIFYTDPEADIGMIRYTYDVPTADDDTVDMNVILLLARFANGFHPHDTIEGAMVYYDMGIEVEGWLDLDGDWYYFRPGSFTMVTGWQYIDGSWYYFYPDGHMAISEWIWLPLSGDNPADSFNYKFFNYRGESINQFLTENGSIWLSQAGPYKSYARGFWTDPKNGQIYYFRTSSGSMVTGWQYIDGSWRYFRPSGTQAFGWQYIDGSWYFLRAGSGSRVTGWQYIDGKWHSFRSDGRLNGRR